MAARLYPASGAKVFIGGVKAFNSTDFSVGDFAAETFTEIAGVTDMGSHGDVAEVIKSSRVAEKRVRKAIGARDAGQKEIVVDFDSADPGQQAAVAAAATDFAYAFKVVFNDAPSPGGSGSIRYFTGFVLSVVEGVGTSSDALKRTIAIEVESNLVAVPATA